MENQVNTNGKNNQKITESADRGVLQKLMEPRVFILIVLLMILSLGSIIVGIYYQQKQIITNQERTVKFQKPDDALSSPKVSPFLEILDTKNQIPVESEKEPTVIVMSGGKGCQPDFFDPQTTKYEYLQQTEKTGGYWAKDIYQVRETDRNYVFSIKTISAPPFTITDYEFGCASSFDHVLDIRKDDKRISLYTHVNTFYLNDDKNLLFLDNYLKNQKGTYDHKRRIISVDGTKKTDIPSLDCVSSGARWTNNTLITYSAEPDRQKGEKTKICVWDQNGSLNNRLQAELTWYGAAHNFLWAEIGVLPSDPNVFYAYDMDTANSPHQCSIFLQDLNVQEKHKTIALFPEEGFSRDLCPNAPFIELDLLNTTFENPEIRFKVNDGAFGSPGLYVNFRNWSSANKAVSSLFNDTTVNWPTYHSIDNLLMFKYPRDWQAEKAEVFGSITVTEFKYNNTVLFELTLHGNYNQVTGKPYNSLNEFLGPKLIKSKDIFIDGQVAKKIEDQGEPGHVIPYEEAIVFTPDNKTVVSLNYKGSYYDKPTANGVLDQILSTFKFINPENTEATTNANAISYNIPSDWQTFTNSLGKSKLTFRYPHGVSAQYNDYSIKRSVQLMKGNRLLLDISLPGYFWFKEYQSGSRREWFLENAKRNTTVQNITFYPIDFANGNSFYQAKADKINNLFGIIPVESQINVYFGVIENKTLIIRDWEALPQEDVFRVLQSIKFKTEYSDLSELKTADVLVQDGSYYGPPFDPDLYQLEINESFHLFAKSDKVNLKQYLGKRIKVSYREVKGIVMTEQQLVIVESVE